MASSSNHLPTVSPEEHQKGWIAFMSLTKKVVVIVSLILFGLFLHYSG